MNKIWLKKGVIQAGVALIFALALAGCFENTLPPGVIARVNGEDIQLRSLQAILDSQSGSLGTAPRASLEEMKENYVHALGLVIARTLVRQEIASRGLTMSDNEYASFMSELKNDIAPDNLDEQLMAASISEEDWEKQIQDYLAMEIFRNRILQPGIKIGLDEIKAYYNSHQRDFQLPPTISLCLGSASSREALLEWCARGSEKSRDVLSQCMDVAETELPADAPKFKNDDMGKCSPIFQENEEWRAWLPLKKSPARTVSPVEAYALIERILLAEKQKEAFDKWLGEKIFSSSIQVVPALNESLTEMVGKSDSDSGDS